MSLRDDVQIARRFQRSIKVEADLGSPQALDGYLCPASSAEALLALSRHIRETGHAAFTWTGPYGTGKSSLALALCAALSGKEKLRDAAKQALGDKVTDALAKAFPFKGRPWRTIAITGRRVPLAALIGDALQQANKNTTRVRWTDERVLAALSESSNQASCGGLLLVIDEMGKVLEGAAHDGHDIYLLQQIAEFASRSQGRLAFIGILHQSFDEYAYRLAREARDEWAKIQGRFVDLIINTAGDEQIELLARAIETHKRPAVFAALAKDTVKLIAESRPAATASLPALLTRCWPLHPVTACLLGPLSRRRFGQNQRSLFAFLNSAEPFGLQDFLRTAQSQDLYHPAMLWDYLRANLEPAILASSDGHRWSVAADAIERCRAATETTQHVDLLKTIALIDLFRERSGLSASKELLALCVSRDARASIGATLQTLNEQSLIVFRRHAGAYALHAGSDFDIEEAIKANLPKPEALDLQKLHKLAGLQPVLAKRHYHTTGAMRWFQLQLVPVKDIVRNSQSVQRDDAAGRFLLAVPTQGETRQAAAGLCQRAAAQAPANIVIGLSNRAWDIMALACELIALTAISEHTPELRGDAVARREVMARLSDCRTRLEQQLQRMGDAAEWFRGKSKPERFGSAALNTLASVLADQRYPDAPTIDNELLCRVSPSSNAIKAQKDLMRRMIIGQGEPRLGIAGYPAEGGLCDSILIKTRLYRKDRHGQWRFMEPDARHDEARILPLWKDAYTYLAEHAQEAVPLSRIFDRWRAPPYGVKDGLMPVLAVALFLAHRDKLAIYRQGVFQATVTDIDIETLASNPSEVQLRSMKLSQSSAKILRDLADFAAHSRTLNGATPDEALEVARGLIAAYDQLPPYARRTNRLPAAAQKLSVLFRNAADPNKLLFNDLPAMAHDPGDRPRDVAKLVREGMLVLQNIYPDTLRKLEGSLLRELDVADATPANLASLRERALHLRQLSGDFRSNAFVARLAEYHGQLSDIEGLASLAINKRALDWVDADIDDARLELAQLGQKFIRDEAFAHVDDRPDKRMRMAVVVPLHGQPRTLQREFDVTDRDQGDVQTLIAQVEKTLARADAQRKNVILAALAEVSARYLQDTPAVSERKGRGTR